MYCSKKCKTNSECVNGLKEIECIMCNEKLYTSIYNEGNVCDMCSNKFGICEACGKSIKN